MAAPTYQDYFVIGRAEAISRRPDLTFDEGDISEFYMAATAAMADHLTGYTAGRINATFLDGATGDDLTILADDHWNIQRNPAISATGVVTFSRTTTTAGGGTIPAGTVVSTAVDAQGNTVQFTTDNDLTFAGTDLSKTMTATATVLDTTGNVSAGTITKIIPTLFDLSFQVTNADRFAGGSDAEADDSLRERVRQYPSTIRRGTLSALEYGALTVDGVATATAVEGNGFVTVYVSDASGNASPTMVANVLAELQNWRAAGVTLSVAGGQLVTQDITVQLTVRSGTNVSALVSQIQAAVVARLNKLKIGELLSRDIIKQAVLNVDPNIIAVAVTLPGADVQPTASQVIRAGAVSVS